MKYSIKNKIIHYFKNLKINSKYIISISSFVIIFFILFGTILYNIERKKILKRLNETISENLVNIGNIITTHTQEKRNHVNSAIETATYLFNQNELIENDSNKIEYSAKNYFTGKSKKISLPVWMHNGVALQSNNDFVDLISAKTGHKSTIFQKIPEGFLCISSSVLKTDKTRAIGHYIPMSSEIIQTLNEGSNFDGRTIIENTWYIASFKPLYIQNSLKGAIYIGDEEITFDVIKPILKIKNYFNTGFPFLVYENGNILIHPTLEGQNINHLKYFQEMKKKLLNENQQTIDIHYKINGKQKTIYAYCLKDIGLFVSIELEDKQIFAELNASRNKLIIAFFIAIILLSIGIYYLTKPMLSAIKDISKGIQFISLGKLNYKIKDIAKDELGDIAKAVNTLGNSLAEKAKFANEIEKGNFNSPFLPASDEDLLGLSLIDMQNGLKQSKELEEERRKKDEQDSKLGQGYTRILEIIRENSNSLEELSYSVIIEIVNYSQTQLGGVFLIEENDYGKKLVKMKATFAYNRKRKLIKEFAINEGIIGRAIYEAKTIYLTEIPEDYIKITSGLGEEVPSALLVTPLLHDKSVFGVLEIASFKPIEPYQIAYIEKAAESFASAISALKSTIETNDLLENFKQQSEQLTSQEEELRQNLEELVATQEESQRRESMMKENMMELLEMREDLKKKEYEKDELIQKLKADNNRKIEEIFQKERQTQSILEYCDEGIITIKKNGTIDFINKTLLLTLGFEENEVLGKTINTLLEEGIFPSERKNLEEYLPTIDGKEFKCKMLRRDRSMIPIKLTLMKMQFSERLKYTLYVINMTKYAELNHEYETEKEKNQYQLYVQKSRILSYEEIFDQKEIPFDSDSIKLKMLFWLDQYSIQLESADRQHLKWFDGINLAYHNFVFNADKNSLIAYLNEIEVVTDEVFQWEERYFQRYDFTEANQHILEHKEFINTIHSEKLNIEKRYIRPRVYLFEFIRIWIVNHIQNSDIKYVSCFKKGGLR